MPYHPCKIELLQIWNNIPNCTTEHNDSQPKKIFPCKSA